LDAGRLERVLFALVASRALAPSSKLEVTRWVADDVHIPGLDGLDADQCYRAMDFLLEALDELQETCSSPPPTCSTCRSTSSSSTPPRPTSSPDLGLSMAWSKQTAPWRLGRQGSSETRKHCHGG
jgi:hypothetical protein